MKLRIATRKSALALSQTRYVAARLKAQHPDLEIEEVTVATKGDRVLDKPLASIGGKGLFVSEVEGLVCRGEADVAVHSLKDVPGDVELAEGMDLICIPEREDPRDVLVSPSGGDLAEVPKEGRVGTTSLRRAAQLKGRRPDLRFDTLRGNVGTRLSRLDEGHFDAIVLAAAGLRRLSLLDGRPHHILSPDVCLPAVGQGTLAIEGRADDGRLAELFAPLEDDATRIRTEAERALLKSLEGSCRVPLAGYAAYDEKSGRLTVDGLVGSVDGERILSSCADRYLDGRSTAERREEAATLGRELAKRLIDQGARELMRQAEAAVLRREREGNGKGKDGDRYKWST